MNRALYLLCVAGLISPGLLGVGCIPYIYPKLDYVPGNDPGPKATDVHAFRVDVTADVTLVVGESGQYTITEIAPRPDGSIPPQARVTVEYGSTFFIHPLGRWHQTRVRLYRPGYQLVERHAWEVGDEISWQSATDWTAQEKAIDDLFARPVLSRHGGCNRSGEHPQPLTSTGAMRAALFIAAEYERVAKLATTPKDAERLQGKASAIRELTSEAARSGGTSASRPISVSP